MRLTVILSLGWALGLVLGSLGSNTAEAQPLVIEAKRVVALQREAENPSTGRYDWGPSVMKDGEIYRMWWTRLGGGHTRRFPYRGTLPDGETYEFTYPDWGDRIDYAESRDGVAWHIEGDDYSGPPDQFGPNAKSPMRVLSPLENAQERNHVGNPSVLKVEGVYYLYKDKAYTWDLYRCDVEARLLE